jgi:hypothetical protein
MGLNEQLEQIQKDLKKIKGEEEEKSNVFRFPFGKKVGKGQAKKNYITIIKVNENGHPTWLKEPIKEQTVIVDGIPRLATPEYIIQYKKCPLMVLPSWSVEPINWKKHHDESLTNGTNTAGYQLLLNRMKLSGVETKKKGFPSWLMWVIGGGVVAFIIYALVTGKI